MNDTTIDSAMVLAAGLGRRMLPITEKLPKPLVRVAGKTLIDHALDALAKAGVGRAVVNVHHLAGQIVEHLATRTSPQIVISDETAALLDSGGGVVNALPRLGARPFLILNADTFWLEAADAGPTTLSRMIAAYDEGSHDILMLVVDPRDATGHEGRGDFTMDEDGRLKRYDGMAGEAVIYAGALIVHPRIFADAPDGPFSLNRCFDAALAADRMRGIRLQGHWLTVGTPAAIGEAEAVIESLRPARLSA
jgi:N-acetyl-alpha-D-muramate 1-phosphate uridylyltransferase